MRLKMTWERNEDGELVYYDKLNTEGFVYNKQIRFINEIETNDRFDRLTNLDISTHYRDREYWFMRSKAGPG